MVRQERAASSQQLPDNSKKKKKKQTSVPCLLFEDVIITVGISKSHIQGFSLKDNMEEGEEEEVELVCPSCHHALKLLTWGEEEIGRTEGKEW